MSGLADVIVYVASDERYNDAVPTQFLDLLLQTGKPVIAVLMKMREADAPALIEHFKKEVLAKLHGRVLSVLAVPFLSKAELADPARMAGRYRIPLLNQVAVLGRPGRGPAAQRRRRRQLPDAHTQQSLLAVARQDLAALQTWREIVLAGQTEFDLRYRREYLQRLEVPPLRRGAGAADRPAGTARRRQAGQRHALGAARRRTGCSRGWWSKR